MFFKSHGILTLLLLFILIGGCETTQKLAKHQNLSYIYNPGSSIMHPEFRIFHQNDSVSLVFMRIAKNEIKFLHSDENNIYTGKLKVHFVLFNSFEKNEVLDSASSSFNLETIETNEYFTANIPVRTRSRINSQLYIIIRDLQAQSWFQAFIPVDKNDPGSAQNYLVTSGKENILRFNDYITDRDSIHLLNNRLKIKKVYIKYMRNKFPMPLPPWSINNARPLQFKPDSVWTVEMNDSTYFNFAGKGIYHIQADSANLSGITLFFFDNSFPLVNTPENLFNPLQYLSTSKEWNEFLAYKNRKLAVDDFWLKLSGNTDRARELIRVYYNRVILANKYFTSYMEGWKSDRGMIYIILGLPSTIYKNDNMERWVYGKNVNQAEMIFDFVKQDNPLSSNDYTLLHSEKYKNLWFIAVETWRDGRIYSVAE